MTDKLDETALENKSVGLYKKNIVFFQKLLEQIQGTSFEDAAEELKAYDEDIRTRRDKVLDFVYSVHIPRLVPRYAAITNHDLSKLFVSINDQIMLFDYKRLSAEELISKVITKIKCLIKILEVLESIDNEQGERFSVQDFIMTLESTVNIEFGFENFSSFREFITLRTLVINAIRAHCINIKIERKTRNG